MRHKYPIWFSGKLRAYVKKNYFYRRYKKYKTNYFYWKLVKRTIKPDRFHWLQFVDENLKLNPQQFWTYISQHRKKYNDLTHLDDGVFLNEPHDVAEAFCKHFQLVFNNSSFGSDTPFFF
jgi:hypothetical protein